MKIIILGAGQVGGTLAAHLVREDNDITVVDHRADKLKQLQERLDIRTVVGCASHPNVLMNAGAEDADMLVAVTSGDEINMIACQAAYTLFRTPTKIARIRSNAYMTNQRLFCNDALPIDVVISPEQLVTDYIRRLIEKPDALQVLNFADGRVQLVAVRAYYGGPLVGHALRELHDHLPKVDTHIAAIFRQGSPIIPSGNTIIEPDDEVFFIAARENIRAVMSELRRLDRPNHRVIIAGGGNIGTRLAESIESDYNVKIIDHNLERIHELGLHLNDTVILHGDASDRDLLLEENIQETDVFCAVTDRDEANIMSCLLAKKLGARKVIGLVSKPAYVDVIEASEIDIAVSPQLITIGGLLAYVRRGDVVNVHSLRRGAAEAIEAIAHGSRKSSKVVGRPISDIKLPPGTTIAAVVRGEAVIIARQDTVIEAEDHVILFLVDKRHIHEVEKLFQVGLAFF